MNYINYQSIKDFKSTIIIGDCSRNNIYGYLDLLNDDQLSISIISKYIDLNQYCQTKNNIQLNNLIGQYDIYIYIEPDVGTLILKRPVIIFTSHLFFKAPENSTFIALTRPRHPLTIAPLEPVEYLNTTFLLDCIDYSNVIILSSNTNMKHSGIFPVWNEMSFVIIDLTHHKKVLHAFLDVLLGMEIIIYNNDYVKDWVLCFPPNMLEEYKGLIKKHMSLINNIKLHIGTKNMINAIYKTYGIS